MGLRAHLRGRCRGPSSHPSVEASRGGTHPVDDAAPRDSSLQRTAGSSQQLVRGVQHRQAVPEHPDRAAGLQAGPDVDTGDLPAAQEHDGQGAGVVDEHELERRASRAGTRSGPSAPRRRRGPGRASAPR